jgi:hypothetical protein
VPYIRSDRRGPFTCGKCLLPTQSIRPVWDRAHWRRVWVCPDCFAGVQADTAAKIREEFRAKRKSR